MDRTALMMEADRRGLLDPAQKAMLDEAIKRGIVAAPEPAAVSAGNKLRQIPRQLGLTVRYGAEGLADAAGIVTEPIRAILNPVLGAAGLPKADSVRALTSTVGDMIGLPKPESANERVVGDMSRMVAGAGGLTGAAGAASRAVAAPMAQTVGNLMAANPGAQAVSAAGAEGAGGSVREAGGGPGEQFVASLAGGLTAAGLTALATKAYGAIANTFRGMMAPKIGTTEVNVILNQILEQNGVSVSQLPQAVRTGLAEEVKRALDTKSQLNPDVIRRIADYGVVGATPTRGSVTLDPVQITQERNLAKVGANSTDERLHELARVQNTNNTKFIENLNTMGGGTRNADPRVAGEAVTGAIRGQDAAAKATENSLYKAARDSSGRAINLDREGFVFDAYNKLAEGNKGAFLPDSIKTILEQLRAGKMKLPDGREVLVPFNVDSIDNIKTILATASRGAADGNVRSALKIVRDALENVQPRATGRPVGGNQVVDPAKLAAAQGQADSLSSASMSAFDEARKFARTRRNWQESAEGIKAALDDVPADRFVQDYILSNSNKAATAEVEKLLFTLHDQPAALQAVKENVVAYLKGKALGGAADEVGNFSQSGFNRAMKELGDAKLKLFFSDHEIAQLKALGRVASYEMVQPKGSAVNNSNTAGAVAGLLDRIASSPFVSRIPFAEAAVQGPARNWSAQIGARRAMDPYAAAALPLPTAAKRGLTISDLVGPGLLLAAPRSDGRNDEKRR